MLSQWIRVFFSDNGALTDKSIAAQDGSGMAFPAVAAQDYIYVGQYFPFNNLFIEMSTTVNDEASILSCEYWDSRQWRSGVDFVDGTNVSGATLARSGVFQFSPNRNYSWQYVVDTSDPQGVPAELSTLSIYDLYWLRLKVSANLDAATVLKKISYAFTTNEAMRSIDPDIDKYLVPWGGATKTSWNEQIILASQHLVADLKGRQLIVGVGNLVRFDDISLAVAYRTNALIYSQLGAAFKDKYADAIKQYESLLNLKRFTIDKNNNAQVERNEVSQTVGSLIR